MARQDAQASAEATRAHLARLIEKRDRLNESIRETAEALGPQAARACWEPAEVVTAWELIRTANLAGVADAFLRALGVARHVVVEWRDFPERAQRIFGESTVRGTFPVNRSPLPSRGTGCVYVLMDDDNAHLYVGYSINVRERFKAHRRERRIPATRYEIIVCSSPEDAFQLEGDLIFQHRPPYNRSSTQTRRAA